MQRRDLLKSVGAGITILKSGTLRGQNAPSNKLNIALIGVWGRGTAHYNVAATTRTWWPSATSTTMRTKEALEIFPKAKTYWDWRRLLDQKDVEAVMICTADHHHAFIANWALNRNMHVYCEKPLGHQRRRGARGARELSQQAREGRDAARDAAARLSEFRTGARAGAGRRDRRAEDGARWDSRQLPRPGYPAARGHAAGRAALRAVDRAVALPSVQPAILRRHRTG